MRQFAFYSSTPEKHTMSRMEAIQKGIKHREENPPENSQDAIIAPTEIHFPEIDPDYDYLRVLFFRSGQVSTGGMSMAPLTWTELRNFRLESKMIIHSWEMDIIKRLSEEFCSEYTKGSNPQQPAPYVKVVENTEEEKIAKAITMLDMLKSFNNRV